MKKMLLKSISLVLVVCILMSTSTVFAIEDDGGSVAQIQISGIAVEKESTVASELPDEEYTEYTGDDNTSLVFSNYELSDDTITLEGYVNSNNAEIQIELSGTLKKWDENAVFAELSDTSGNWEIMNFAIYYDTEKAIIFDNSLKDNNSPVFSLCMKNIDDGTYYIFETNDFALSNSIEANINNFSDADSSEILWIAKYIKDKDFTASDGSINPSLRAIADTVTYTKTYTNSYTFNGESWCEYMVVVHGVQAPTDLSNSQDAKAFINIDDTYTTVDGSYYIGECPTIELGHGASSSDPGTSIEAILQNSDHCFNSMQVDAQGTQVGSAEITIGLSYSVPNTILSFDLSYTSTADLDLNETYTSFVNYAPNHYNRTADAIYDNGHILTEIDDNYTVDYTITDLTTTTSSSCYLSCKFSYLVYDGYSYEDLYDFTRTINNYYSE